MTNTWPRPGTLLDSRYRLIEQLGEGGMSAVWRAHDAILGRPVAIKVLAGPYASDERCRAIIGREARAAARLSHRHIVAVYDYGETRGPDDTVLPFVVMELLDGEPLQARLDAGERLSWQDAVETCAQIADALAHAHLNDVVHRDVTPGNTILTRDGLKVVDFGIAAAIGEPDDDSTGLMFGTLEYVAPERLDGGPADAATDVFSIGVLLYELTTGHAPFPANSWEELTEAYEAGPPTSPAKLPPDLAALCLRCLAHKPGDRPSAAEVAAALARTVADRNRARTTVIPRRTTPMRTDAASASTAGASAATLTAAASGTAPSSTAAVGRQPLAPLGDDELDPPVPPSDRRRVAVTVGLIAASVAVISVPFLLDAKWQDSTRTPAATASASPTVAPTLSLPPTAQPSPAEPSPTTSPTPTESAPTGAVLDPLAQFASVLDASLANGEIRNDVATDMRNLLNNISRSDAQSANQQLSALQRKIDDRQREGGVSAAAAERLRRAIGPVA